MAASSANSESLSEKCFLLSVRSDLSMSCAQLRRWFRFYFCWIFCGCLLTVPLAGCDEEDPLGPTGTVHGQLALDGQPLQAGTHVVFQHGDRGYLAYGTTNATGEFTIDSWNNGQLPVGGYEIAIQPPKPKVDLESIDAQQLIEHPELAKQARTVVDFPSTYRSPITSGLKYTVNTGDNRFEIELHKQTPTSRR